MIELKMPRLSDSMQEGTILTWLKTDGEYVETGEELLEIETDKATMAQVAEASGVLQILAAEGQSVDVGAPIGLLHETDDSPPPTATASRRSPSPP